jgi:hypothetical protein
MTVPVSDSEYVISVFRSWLCDEYMLWKPEDEHCQKTLEPHVSIVHVYITHTHMCVCLIFCVFSSRFQCVYQGTSHSCKVSRLQEMTVYRFRIAAANDAGQGDYSEIQEFSTCIAPPPSLKGISYVHLC